MSPEPTTEFCTLTYPALHILLVTLNQPQKLNCLGLEDHYELSSVWEYLDNNDQLRVGIVAGEGRAFCGGADLKEWATAMTTPSEPVHLLPSSGFGGLSLRTGTKPIIAAVSGLCVGGGTEMLLGCDIVVASRRASFTLPDVKVGLTLLGGAAPALVGKIGRGRASEMVFTGRTVSAIEAESWGLVDKLVKDDGRDVVQHAIDMAKMIAANSPHAVEVSRRGLMLGESDMGVREAGRIFIDEEWKGLKDGGDPAEGVRAFVERRPPVWGKGKVMGESNL